MDELSPVSKAIENLQGCLDDVDEKLEALLTYCNQLIYAFNEFRQECKTDPRLNAQEPIVLEPQRSGAESSPEIELPESRTSVVRRAPAPRAHVQRIPVRGAELPADGRDQLAPISHLETQASSVPVTSSGPRSPKDIAANHPDAVSVHWDDLSKTFQEGSGAADCAVFDENGRSWMIPTSNYLDHPSIFNSRLSHAFRWSEPKRGAIVVISMAEVLRVTGGRFSVITPGEIASAR